MKEEQKNEHRMVFARRMAARAWCREKTSGKTMDPELANEFAKILSVHMYKPHLGCATTRELLAEITARVSGGPLDYRTNECGLKAVD